ncbi:MAG: ISKra4 family transposase, partial [Leptolyngbyaceae cyanobacterium SU_3_3]|nr:ISKra4 family transposase [Leptolyngbyaceae cyanobacterium SU_3_3]
MPYNLASWMLSQWSGLSVSASTLWKWVQLMGSKAQQELEAQLVAQACGAQVPCEAISQALSALPLAIAADGVMVPFRPTPKTTKGKIQWREVKVAILARLGTRVTQAKKVVPQLLRRRLVAVLGDIDQFIPLLQLEAHKQDFESAPKVIWLSDGGRGFWRVYRTLFSHCAVAVLDFFHAAGHLARATQAMFGDSRSSPAQAWFRCWRHQLRHGQHLQVLRALTVLIHSQLFTGKSFTTLLQVQAYFQRHHRHIRYRHFEQQR